MASKLNPGADATLVGVAYRAAMADTPGDYSGKLERAADSYAKTMEASSDMWGNIAKVGAAIGSEMMANAQELTDMVAKGATLNPTDAEMFTNEIYGIKDELNSLGMFSGQFGDRETRLKRAKLKIKQQELFADIDNAVANLKVGADAVAAGTFDADLAMVEGDMVNAIIKSNLKNNVTDNKNIAKLSRDENGELMYTLYNVENNPDGEVLTDENGKPRTMTIKQFNESIATNVKDGGAMMTAFGSLTEEEANAGNKALNGTYDPERKQMTLNKLDTLLGDKPVNLKRAMRTPIGYSNTSFFDDITKEQGEHSVGLYKDLLEATGGNVLTGKITEGMVDIDGVEGISEQEAMNANNYKILTGNIIGLKDPEASKAYFKEYAVKEMEAAYKYGYSKKPPVGGGVDGADAGEHVGTSMPGVGWVPGEKKKEFRGYIDKFQDFQGNYGNWKFDKSEGKYYDSDAEEKAFISAYEVAQKEDAAKGDSADMFKYTVEDLEENKPLNMVGEPVEGGVYGNFFQKDDDDALPLLKKMFPSSFTFEETGMWGWGKGIEIFHPTLGSLGTYSFRRDAGSEADDQAKEFNSNMAQYFVGASGGTGAKYNKKKDNK